MERSIRKECGFVPETSLATCSAANKDLRNNKQVKFILKKERFVAEVFEKYRVREFLFAPFGFDRNGKEMHPTEELCPQPSFKYKIQYELPNGFIQTYCFNAST